MYCPLHWQSWECRAGGHSVSRVDRRAHYFPIQDLPQSVFMWTRQHSGASTLYLYLHYLHLPLPLLCSVGCIISSSGPGPLWAGPRKHFPCELWPPKAQHLQLLQEEHRTSCPWSCLLLSYLKGCLFGGSPNGGVHFHCFTNLQTNNSRKIFN